MEKLEAKGISFLAGCWPLDPQKATLVFIHGAGGSAERWVKQIEGLNGRVNTVAVDLPGHGRSEGAGKSTVKDYAREVFDFILSLGEGRFIPAGLSMGGAITQQLLLDHPGRFPAAVLVSTGARLRVLPQILETIEQDYPAFVESVGRFAASPKTPAEVMKPVLEDMAKCKAEVVLNDFRACDAFDVISKLEQVTVPVLIISAEDDFLTPPRYGDLLAQNLKGAHRVHFQDAGHMVPVEKAAEFNRAIVRFLDELGL